MQDGSFRVGVGASGLDHEKFDPLAFFTGHVIAHGIFEDRFGRIQRRFRISMHGVAMPDASLAVEEVLTFDDGAIDTRHWTLSHDGQDRFLMVGPDIVGKAVGLITGSTAELRYVYQLKVGNRIIPVRMRDRLHRINPDRVVNRATLRKFGIHLGDISAAFERR
jgi:Protein of unknown function (DUF3833)